MVTAGIVEDLAVVGVALLGLSVVIVGSFDVDAMADEVSLACSDVVRSAEVVRSVDVVGSRDVVGWREVVVGSSDVVVGSLDVVGALDVVGSAEELLVCSSRDVDASVAEVGVSRVDVTSARLLDSLCVVVVGSSDSVDLVVVDSDSGVVGCTCFVVLLDSIISVV